MVAISTTTILREGKRRGKKKQMTFGLLNRSLTVALLSRRREELLFQKGPSCRVTKQSLVAFVLVRRDRQLQRIEEYSYYVKEMFLIASTASCIYLLHNSTDYDSDTDYCTDRKSVV